MANILIVDDAKIARKFLRDVLIENGHKIVAEGSNGEEGYELYVKHMPDLVMIDITMPVLDGISCLKRIKGEFPASRAIMVSSLGTDSKKRASMDAGAFGFVVKPFDPEELVEMVERCLRS